MRPDIDYESSRTGRPGLLDAAALLILLALCLAIHWPQLRGIVGPQDEAILLVYPDLIRRGLVPYRDFAVLYPPGNFYLLAALYSVFGESVLVERTVGIVYWLSIASVVYLLGRTVSRLTGFVAGLAVLCALKYLGVGAYSIVGAIALALAALLFMSRSHAADDDRSRSRWALWAGLAAGLTCTFRNDVGLAIGFALAVCFWSRPLTRLLNFFAGAALALVPLAAFYAVAGFQVAFDSMVLDALRIGPGRRLPIELDPFLGGLLFLVAFNVLVAVAMHFKAFSSSDNFPNDTGSPLPRGRQQIGDAVVLTRGMAILSIGLLPYVFQRADRWHAVTVGAPILGLAVVSLGIAVCSYLPRLRHARAIAAAILVASAAGAVWFGYEVLQVDRPVHAVTSGNRLIYWDRDSRDDLQRLVDEVNAVARPGERLFVGPGDLRFSNVNDSHLYFLLPQLVPATRYLEMNPGAANRAASLLHEQIGTADWVILTNHYRFWSEKNASMIPGPDLSNQVIAKKFCDHRTFGDWQLLRRCKAPPVAEAPPLGVPVPSTPASPAQ